MEIKIQIETDDKSRMTFTLEEAIKLRDMLDRLLGGKYNQVRPHPEPAQPAATYWQETAWKP